MNLNILSKNIEFTPNRDVNIIVGDNEKAKNEFVTEVFRYYISHGKLVKDLSIFYVCGYLQSWNNITEDVEKMILDACRKNEVVIINLVGDLLFIKNQQELINKCLKVNPKVQLFINTNSPSIFGLYE